VCFRDYGISSAIYACLAVLTALIFFLLSSFRSAPQDPYLKAHHAEERYQIDLKTREYCFKLRASYLA
jgi:hypothetical protein